jgi:acyl carrier protein
MDDNVATRRQTRSILAAILCKNIIAKELRVDEKEVIPAALFREDLGADEWDMVELLFAFEEVFEIKIPDKAAERIRTVEHAVHFITKHAPGCERWFPFEKPERPDNDRSGPRLRFVMSR